MTTVQFLSIGLVAGVFSGMFGIGGGLIIVPALVFLMGFKLHSAIGTSLGALLLPVGLLGVLTYFKAGHIDVRAALLVAAGLFVGVYFGSKLVLGIPPVLLRKVYAVFLIGVSIKFLLAK